MSNPTRLTSIGDEMQIKGMVKETKMLEVLGEFETIFAELDSLAMF